MRLLQSLSLSLVLLAIQACQQAAPTMPLPAAAADSTASMSKKEETKPAEATPVPTPNPQGNFKPIETLSLDLNGDGQADKISLGVGPLEGDPGTFQRIKIELGGDYTYVFSSKDIWDEVDAAFAKKYPNRLRSKYVHVSTYDENRQAILLLFGFVYGTGRSEMAVIHVQGKTAKLLFQDALDFWTKFDVQADKVYLAGGRNQEATSGAGAKSKQLSTFVIEKGQWSAE